MRIPRRDGVSFYRTTGALRPLWVTTLSTNIQASVKWISNGRQPDNVAEVAPDWPNAEHVATLSKDRLQHLFSVVEEQVKVCVKISGTVVPLQV